MIGQSGLLVPLAGPRQRSQRVGHLPKLHDPGLHLGDMGQGDRLHIRAGAVTVAPEFQQVANALNGKAEIARPADEAQPVQVGLVIVAIVALAPAGGGD